MIRIKTKWNQETNEVQIDYKHKNSSLLEHLVLLQKMLQEIRKNTDITNKEIFKILKDFDKLEEKEEIEVL